MKNTVQRMISEIEKDLNTLNYLIDKAHDLTLDEVSLTQRNKLERERDKKLNQLIELFKKKDELNHETV